MIITKTSLSGAHILDPQINEDNRGFFTRLWCQEEFAKSGINTKIAQTSLSYNKLKGTIRGMHFQKSPFEEEKTVTVVKGAIFDVIVDLRPTSKTYLKWLGVELNDRNLKSVYIPKNFAHGFQTLEDNTTVLYQISEFYKPESAQGIRWDDLRLKINWPIPCSVVSEKDRSYKNYE